MSSPTPQAALALVAVLVLSSAAALAADGDEDGLIREGVARRRKSNDAGALEIFSKAYDMHHSPRAAAQMGWAEIALGRWVDAEGHLVEAMASAADPWVAQHLATLKESLGRVRQHVGALEVLGGPPGAEIVIEGVVVGKLPLGKPLRARSGDCRFVVRASGYEPDTRTVDVPAGQLTRETVNLSQIVASRRVATDATAAAVSLSTPNEEPATAAASPVKEDVETRATTTGKASALPTVGVVLGSVGLVAVGAGVVFSIKTRAATRDAAGDARFDPAADNSGHHYEVLQYVAYGLGAALLAAGVTTFVLGSDRGDTSGNQVAVVPSPAGATAILMGRF